MKRRIEMHYAIVDGYPEKKVTKSIKENGFKILCMSDAHEYDKNVEEGKTIIFYAKPVERDKASKKTNLSMAANPFFNPVTSPIPPMSPPPMPKVKMQEVPVKPINAEVNISFDTEKLTNADVVKAVNEMSKALKKFNSKNDLI